ncbi:hypothetical protein CEXT_285001 [Caerostris extrusa]|uniref:Uncharacterized protein n=1 Tax=Caerostris extrusa TaxID=172846 RepID=A0AAV4XC97_CAEEX|nr:hypothetical protein CEXT_285001 [Caerostris extrusa]
MYWGFRARLQNQDSKLLLNLEKINATNTLNETGGAIHNFRLENSWEPRDKSELEIRGVDENGNSVSFPWLMQL